MSATEKDPKSPATTSSAYDCMMPFWKMIEAVLGGTDTMRAAGETYLPRHSEETDEGYQARLLGSVLLNYLDKTSRDLASKPFSEPVKPSEDVPPQMVDEIFPDVDLQGNNIDVFSRLWFREGLNKAFSHVLVEFPRLAPVEGKPRTLADDRKENVRPYWVPIRPECLFFARYAMVNGIETLVHVRILETYTEVDGFADVEKSRIRVLEPGLNQIWELKKIAGKEQWVKTDEWSTELDYIPLVTFYTDKKGFMVGKPPLLDLAHLNITHWISTSEQRHILTVTRFPILACSGASQEDSAPITIGPNKVLYNPSPQGKFYYVEHAGAAIDAGAQDLEKLEEQMAGYGSMFLREEPGDQTATARALDSAESTSDLSTMALMFEDAMAQLLQMTADYMKLSVSGGTIEVVKDFDMAQPDSTGIDLLKHMREKRDISRETLLTVAVSLGVLPEDFDAKKDWQLLLDETSSMMGAAGLDLDPAQAERPGLNPLDQPLPKEGDEDVPPKKGAKPPKKKPAAAKPK
jgi:hypothetical protein